MLERQVEKERSPETMIADVEILSKEAEPLDPEGLSHSSTSGSIRSNLRTDSLASARAMSSRETLDRVLGEWNRCLEENEQRL